MMAAGLCILGIFDKYFRKFVSEISSQAASIAWLAHEFVALNFCPHKIRLIITVVASVG